MAFFVYILQSEVNGTLYKGFTTDIHKRLADHNAGPSRYTARYRPWKLVYLEELPSKKDALIREKQIKKLNPVSLKKLIDQYQSKSGQG